MGRGEAIGAGAEHAELGRLARALAAAADPVRGVGDRAGQVRALDMRIGRWQWTLQLGGSGALQ